MHKLNTMSTIILAAAAGGVVGITIQAIAPELRLIPFLSPVMAIIATTIIGAIAGALAVALIPVFRYPGRERKGNIKIKLREEQLDFKKNRIKTANVHIRKEKTTDKKTITVPVTREDLVAEIKTTGNGQESETVRIPLKKEQIAVKKTPRLLNRVTVSKKEYAGTETVEETIKKEKLSVDAKEDARVRN